MSAQKFGNPPFSTEMKSQLPVYKHILILETNQSLLPAQQQVLLLFLFGMNAAIIEGQIKMTFNQQECREKESSPVKNLSINCCFVLKCFEKPNITLKHENL